MPAIPGISDGTVPTSARALQIEKEQRASLRAQKMSSDAKHACILTLLLITLAFSSSLLGCLAGNVIVTSLRKRLHRNQRDLFTDDKEVSDKMIQNDELAMAAGGLRRREKRGIRRSMDEAMEESAELLMMRDLLGFLEENL